MGKWGKEVIHCLNESLHTSASDVQDAVQIPLLHIADATADQIKKEGNYKVGLLGTRFTMEQDFYKGRMREKGFEVLIPSEPDRNPIHRVIYDELCKGKILPESREEFLRISRQFMGDGVQGIVLGCTEIPLLVRREDAPYPLYDTTRIHAEAAVTYALE